MTGWLTPRSWLGGPPCTPTRRPGGGHFSGCSGVPFHVAVASFEAWLQQDGTQHTLWPGRLELTSDFYTTLRHHAVPLDYRALAALKHSALALDIYTWLAHRLCRVRDPRGTMLSWENLRNQFGQKYNDPRNFQREFRAVLHQVRLVYSDARVEETPGGLILFPSRPPLPQTKAAFRLAPSDPPVDKSGG